MDCCKCSYATPYKTHDEIVPGFVCEQQIPIHNVDFIKSVVPDHISRDLSVTNISTFMEEYTLCDLGYEPEDEEDHPDNEAYLNKEYGDRIYRYETCGGTKFESMPHGGGIFIDKLYSDYIYLLSEL